MAIICPNCFMPNFCPCLSCRSEHGQVKPLLWVWGDHEEDSAMCGYCGFPCGVREEWNQILDNLSNPAFYTTKNYGRE